MDVARTRPVIFLQENTYREDFQLDNGNPDRLVAGIPQILFLNLIENDVSAFRDPGRQQNADRLYTPCPVFYHIHSS